MSIYILHNNTHFLPTHSETRHNVKHFCSVYCTVNVIKDSIWPFPQPEWNSHVSELVQIHARTQPIMICLLLIGTFLFKPLIHSNLSFFRMIVMRPWIQGGLIALSSFMTMAVHLCWANTNYDRITVPVQALRYLAVISSRLPHSPVMYPSVYL